MTHEGRVAVVSGAARGLGRAIAEGLASRGARVVAVDLRDAAETVRAIEDAGGECVSLVADVSSEEAVRGLVGEVHRLAGPCGILVNNAGVMRAAPIAEVDFAFWRAILTANLDSQYLMASAFLPDMVARRWGRIVNVASSSLFTSTPGLTAYMASKGGVVGFTSALANDVGEYGITVNAVSPGLTRTPGAEEGIAAGDLPSDAPEAVVELQAIKRPGTPRDLVGLVCFLSSDDAAFMTGQFLVVDGGMTRR